MIVDGESAEPQQRSPRRFGTVAALVAIAAIGLTLIWATGGVGSDDGPFDENPVTIESAQSVADAFFEELAGGDLERVMAFFADDATFSFSLPARTALAIDRMGWERFFVWNEAQGTTATTPECGVTDQVTGVEVTLACEYGVGDALILAIGAELVPTTTTMTIRAEGITRYRDAFGLPDFGTVNLWFRRWMSVNHPAHVDAASLEPGDSSDVAVAKGELRAAYAAEWAAYLEANGCGYRDGC